MGRQPVRWLCTVHRQEHDRALTAANTGAEGAGVALCGVQIHHRYAAPGVPRRGARADAAERQQALVAVHRLQCAFLHRRRALPRQPLPQVRP